MFKQILSRVVAVLILGAGIAWFGWAGAAHADDFLDPDVAFKFKSAEQQGAVEVHFAIAKGYYLYLERFAFDPHGTDVKLGPPAFPPAKTHFDPTLEKNVDTYRDEVTIDVPVAHAGAPFDLDVTYQGCADQGICYPPMHRTIHVSGDALKAVSTAQAASTLAGGTGAPPLNSPAVQSGLPGGHPVDSTDAAQHSSSSASTADSHGAATSDSSTETSPAGAHITPSSQTPEASDASRWQDVLQTQEPAERLLTGRSGPLALGAFFLIGIGLSLLPCTWPMVPILASIVVGQGAEVTRSRGLLLSLIYVIGSACVYAILGVIAGLAGASLTVWLQNPWVLGAFGLLLVAFALSMFGLYELQMPAAWQSRVDGAARRASGGQIAGVFAMGALSALVVGACMTAPLFAVLAYIAQTGNAAFGGAALFAMALGIGAPLLVVGAGAGALLPRAGGWMDSVKRGFGMLLLGVALYIVFPVLPTWLTMIAMAVWALIAAALLGTFEGAASGARPIATRVGKGIGVLLTVAAVIQLTGVAGGSRDPLAPLAVYTGAQGGGRAGDGPSASATVSTLTFAPVASTGALDQAVGTARRQSMLDFYADWCVSCREMEKFTFSDPRVHARLVQLQLLRADVTANNSDDQALLKRFALFGPPGIIFFDSEGREIKSLRVVGFQSPDVFLRSLDAAFGSTTPTDRDSRDRLSGNSNRDRLERIDRSDG
ncbi:protein-disulfide reductase DsbD [Pararobbsia silviterrae]|uniref:Thiol:disulfide interchange protein DsbD n=1 Tax=Pararobbsia silviterrae TaxID=1792498 RepID=A0A494X4R9_9BURK|nr:protein-disulfide reductase DsbD [Pararobbsia silviterrae]RKP45698.1 protein-disulfide reductase DsbD [Pararobbsia silviterrae]